MKLSVFLTTAIFAPALVAAAPATGSPENGMPTGGKPGNGMPGNGNGMPANGGGGHPAPIGPGKGGQWNGPRKCGNHEFSVANQQSAAYLAMSYNITNDMIKGKAGEGFPQHFNNPEKFKFPGCPKATGGFLQFPILRSGQKFNKNQFPRTDRIVYTENGGQAQFCGVITHEGAANGGFKMCQ